MVKRHSFFVLAFACLLLPVAVFAQQTPAAPTRGQQPAPNVAVPPPGTSSRIDAIK